MPNTKYFIILSIKQRKVCFRPHRLFSNSRALEAFQVFLATTSHFLVDLHVIHALVPMHSDRKEARRRVEVGAIASNLATKVA